MNVTGEASSAASFVVQAGDERTMGESTSMFIHPAMGMAIGYARDAKKLSEYLQQTTENIANVYAKRSGRRQDTFLQMMEDDTQLTAAQALDAKLIDAIVPLKKPPAANAMNGTIVEPVTLESINAGIEIARNQEGIAAVNAKSIIDRKL